MKLFNWKGIAIVLTVLAVVIGICSLDLRCSGRLDADSHVVRMKDDWAEEK